MAEMVTLSFGSYAIGAPTLDACRKMLAVLQQADFDRVAQVVKDVRSEKTEEVSEDTVGRVVAGLGPLLYRAPELAQHLVAGSVRTAEGKVPGPAALDEIGRSCTFDDALTVVETLRATGELARWLVRIKNLLPPAWRAAAQQGGAQESSPAPA